MDSEQERFVDGAYKGDPIALTGWLVSIPSVNPVLEKDGAGETAIARACAELLEDWGFKAVINEPAPGRPNVVGQLEGEGPTILLNGHLDTVGVTGMTIDPFDPMKSSQNSITSGLSIYPPLILIAGNEIFSFVTCIDCAFKLKQ